MSHEEPGIRRVSDDPDSSLITRHSSLRTRAASATLIVIGTLLVTIIGGWVFVLAALVVALLALDELMLMLGNVGHRPARLLGHLLVTVFFLVALTGPSSRWLGEAVTLAVIGPLLSVMLRRNLAGTMLDWAVSVAATLYVGWLAAHAILLRMVHAPVTLDAFLLTDLATLLDSYRLPLGTLWVLTAILVTWAVDTAAYATGSAWGRHQMTPLLSPKKTWEGAAGGLVAGLAATIACALVFRLPLSLPAIMLTGLALGVIAQVGDLAESLLKRQTGVKDTGRIIPGHGGVLDRIDALLFVVPATYYLARILYT
jgi:phosphatidate cytidylyltransferase